MFTSGDGAYLTDPDGHQWIDFDNARGSVLLGHGAEVVAEAVARAARGGLGATTGWSPLLDSVLDRVTGLLGGQAHGVYRTGTAALRSVASAVRAARAEQLGADQPLLLSAGYHGYDPMWYPEEQPLVPNRDGVVDFLFDLDVLATWLGQPRPVAAIVISPDLIYLTSEWFARVREMAREADVPIIADEVKVGLRYGPGLSAPELEPDVWVVAKGLANGAPIALTGGSAALLAGLCEVSYTSFFEPTVLAAADATLALVATGAPQREIARNGGRFVDHARTVLAKAGLPIEVAGDGRFFQFVSASDEVEATFLAACQERRLLFYAGDNQAPSVALRDAALDDACERMSQVCSALAGQWADTEISEDARYAAAFRVMDGLAGLPRSPGRTSELISQLWSDD